MSLSILRMLRGGEEVIRELRDGTARKPGVAAPTTVVDQLDSEPIVQVWY